MCSGPVAGFREQLPVCLRDTCDLEAFPCRGPAEREAQRQRLIDEMRRRGRSTHVFGLYTGDETFWLLTYRGSLATQARTAASRTNSSVLDVSLLHDVLLEKVLGLDSEDTIAFTQDDAAAVDLVARQEYQWRSCSIRPHGTDCRASHGAKAHAAQVDLFLS